jgi:diazepam-binding inhibitor (GABA receptor modulator, acyl-CoA-binding protein)
VSQSDFEQAQVKVKTLSTRPSNPDLLQLYALFKQGSEGDVHGKRPGMMDIKGRFKYDAWAGKKGMAKADAQAAYVAKVKGLLAKDGKAW